MSSPSSNWVDLPVNERWLERYRVRARMLPPLGLMGGHQVRRQGQSLEFRDFAEYQPGDDFRHVDWRASARRHSPGLRLGADWLVRRFVAEEKLRLVVSVDTSATMWGTGPLPKLQVASWIAEALARVTLRGDDQVVLHSLFARRSEPVVFRTHGQRGQTRAALGRLTGEAAPETGHNLAVLDAHLFPTTAWVILSDFYFPIERGQPLAARMAAAQAGLCWVMTVDLDNWPWERGQLSEGDFRVEGPGVEPPLDPRYEITPERLDRVEQTIRAHKLGFFGQVSLGEADRSHWKWPVGGALDGGAFFREHLERDGVLQRIFVRAGL